jgi:protein CpxP
LKESTMSDQHPPTPEPPSTPPARRRRGRSWLFVITIALAAALTGAVASRAVSQHRWHGPGLMGGAFDPALVEDGADRAVRHVAIEIDATGEQQDKLRAIVKGAVKDLLPIREKALSARQRGRVLLTQPSVDRAAIEALRTEQLALADAASKRFTQALGDVAEVLTPEQRRKIDDRLTEMRERRGFWHGWRRG